MYVCVCNAVSDRSIRAAVKKGASSLADLMVSCDAGTCCGACHPELEAMLEHLQQERVRNGGSAPRPTADAQPPSRS